MSHSLASVGPYIVILIVIIVFFALCALLFRDKPKKAKGRDLRAEVARERAYYKPQDRRDYRPAQPSVEKQNGLGVGGRESMAPQANPVAVGRGSTASAARGLGAQVVNEGKGLHLEGERVQQAEAMAPFEGGEPQGDLTVKMSPDDVQAQQENSAPMSAEGQEPRGIAPSTASAISETSAATNGAVTGGAGTTGLGLGVRPGYPNRTSEATNTGNFGEASDGLSPSYIDHVTAQCAQRYPFLSREGKKQLRDITEGAFKRLALSSVGQTQALLENVIVQEALYRMQEAYLTTPTSWMYKMAVDAFADVVQQPKSSPIYLLAIDALRLFSQLSLGHYQAISVTLLFQSTWNSNNVTKSQWQRYLEKYILPFTEALPRDGAMYKQLHYVRCFQETGDIVPLYALLARMYPYVFAYDGFTKEELNRCLGREHMDGNYVVSSMNSNMLKFAVINHEYMPLVFEQNNIVDEGVQNGLLSLATSRPTRLGGNELRNLLSDISPIMPGLMSIYDNSPLCQSQLTNLGLYIGRLHIKAVIEQDLDISDWI